MVFTVDGDGHERKWGSLSRNIAWKAGRLWEDGNGVVKVFIEKGDERKEVDVEKMNVRGRESFWFLDKNKQPQKTQEAGGKADDNPKRRLPCKKTPPRRETPCR